MWEKTRGREGLHQGLVAFCFQGEVSDHLKCPRLVVCLHCSKRLLEVNWTTLSGIKPAQTAFVCLIELCMRTILAENGKVQIRNALGTDAVPCSF